MIHPHTQLRFVSDEVGHGVFATQSIPQGTVVWARDALDRTFPVSMIESLPENLREALSRYCYCNHEGSWVLCWDHARYMNHSFRPNCLPTAYGFEVAVRDISAGEEMTNDYGCLNIVESFEPASEGTERTWVHSDDLLREHPEWDRMVLEALSRVDSVEQPLGGLLSQETWTTIGRIAGGEMPMQSLKALHCARP